MKPCKITVDLYNTFRERMPEYVQYDRNVPLEITVLENGKPADLNGLFGRLLVSKPDGHEVYSNDVEISGNVITTILGEQVFTASGVAQVTVDILDEQNSKRALIPFGMRIRSAVITDESIKSSNDYQTITALISDVRALDAMFHVEQEQRAEAFNAQMQSQEATFTEAQRQFLADHREAMFHVEQQMTEQADMFHVEQTERAKAFEQSEADREQRFETQTTEWAQTVEQAEATRQFNEERRQSAESKRESAEKARESAEKARESAEKARESAERQRVDTEAVRQRQEQERGQGEAGRATAETNRVKAEQTRVDNESSRKSAESSRVNAESQRATAESQRATAETNRAGAEGRRSEAESNRVTAENNRATAESRRVTAENTREAQENARREAEEDRATRMAQWEAKAEETAQKAQEAVDSAQAFVNTNEERLLTDRDKIDYWGNHHANMKDMTDATVDKILGDFNTLNHTGEYITATETIARHVPRGTLKGHTEVNCIQEPSGSDIVLPYDFEPGYDVMINDTKETGAVGIELQGQTLVNLDKNTYPITKWGTNENSNNYFVDVVTLASGMFKPATKYLFKIYGLSCDYDIVQLQGISGTFSQVTSTGFTFNKNGSLILQSSDSIQTLTSYTPHFRRNDIKNLTEQDKQNFKMIILEYQEGMENWDIPYFEGVQSVKMPVLTTTGKNLLDPNYLKEQCLKISSSATYTDGNIVFNSNAFHQKRLIALDFEPNTRYAFNLKMSGRPNSQLHIMVYYTDSTKTLHIPYIADWTDTISGVTKANATVDYITISYGNGASGCVLYVDECSLFKSDTVMPHEPYQSNILSCNEEVTLRKVGDVQDTLDCLTGEVTERIGEVVLDGSSDEKYSINGNITSDGLTRFVINSISNRKQKGNVISNLLPITNDSGSYGLFSGIGLNIINNCSTVDDLRIWLQQNPITVQYELETESVKTVDLSVVDQNENSVPALSTYNEVTYLRTSSAEGSLRPIASPQNPTYKVMLKPSTQYSIITNPVLNGHESSPIRFNLGGAEVETLVGNNCTLVTTPSTLANNKLEMSGRGQKLQGGVMVLEGNKTGMMFSHFDGMKSVENPTVRVFNSNLISYKDILKANPKAELVEVDGEPWIDCKNTNIHGKVRVFCNPGESYYLRYSGKSDDNDWGIRPTIHYSDGTVTHCSYSGDGRVIIAKSDTGKTIKYLSFDVPWHHQKKNTKLHIPSLCFSKDLINVDDIIPHKENSTSLTIPMRSLPDGTCDTLSLLTGEYVQNVMSRTFIDTSGWSSYNDGGTRVVRAYYYNVDNLKQGNVLNLYCDRLPVNLNAIHGRNEHGVGAHWDGANTRNLRVCINDAELIPFGLDLNEVNATKLPAFNRWLQHKGGLTIDYPLAEPIVTKLDLQWEDGKLFAYDGTTHFFVDVEGGQLMPILDIDVPVNLAQRTSRLCAEKEQLEAEKAQLANEVSVLQLRNAMLQGEIATLEQSNKDLQKEQEKLDKDSQELAHAVTIVDEHREEGDLELLSSDFDFELRLMEIEFAVGIPMMANYKGVRNMARTPYDMAKALILGGKYEREEMIAKLDRFEKLGSITADQKAELIALMDAVELTQ